MPTGDILAVIAPTAEGTEDWRKKNESDVNLADSH
jgi:hypothetical protein